MSIRFGCPSCGKKYAVNEQMMGRTVKCSACDKAFNIPKDPSASGSSSSKLKPARPMRQAASLPQSAPAPTPQGAAANKPPAASSQSAKPPKRTSSASGEFSIETGESSVAASRHVSRPKATKSKNGIALPKIPLVWLCGGGAIAASLIIGVIVVVSMSSPKDTQLVQGNNRGSESANQSNNAAAAKDNEKKPRNDDANSAKEKKEKTDNRFAIGADIKKNDLDRFASKSDTDQPLPKGKAGLIIEWPAHERQQAAMRVNGKPASINNYRGTVKVHYDPGKYDLVLYRMGFQEFRQTVDLTAGVFVTVQPQWKAARVAHRPKVRPDMVKNLDDWSQDFEAAKVRAASEEKDILVAFMGTDWSHWCIRMNWEVFFTEQFKSYADENFVLVLADFPRKQLAKSKVQSAERNEKLSDQFDVDGYPTLIFADSAGHPYGRSNYIEGGFPAFTKAVDELQSGRKERDAVFAKVDEAESGIDKLKAAKAALQWLDENESLSQFESKISEWKALADEHDPENEENYHEVFFKAHWLVQVDAADEEDEETLLALVDELDEWSESREFSDANVGGRMHLTAAMILSMFDMKEEALAHVKAGLEYEPDDYMIAGRLRAGERALSPERGSGSGFVVDKSGYIMTNHHVVATALPPGQRGAYETVEEESDDEEDGESKKKKPKNNYIVVRVPGQDEPVPAEIIAHNVELDMALIKIDPPKGVKFNPIRVSTEAAGRGSPVCALGYPLGDALGAGLKMTIGNVSGLPDKVNNGMVLLDCTVNPGNSGGPLCDNKGNCIGMVTAKTGGYSIDSYGMARPADDIQEFLIENLPGYKGTKRASKKRLDWGEVDKKVSDSVLMIVIMREQTPDFD